MKNKSQNIPYLCGVFTSNPSALCRKTIEQIRALLKAEGLDETQRAVAKAIAEEGHAEYCHLEDVIENDEIPCVNTLKGQRCKHEFICPRIPGGDHVSVLTQKGKMEAIVSQPYNLWHDDLKETLDFAEIYGLEVSISSGSWYFPGRALLVEFTGKEK